MQPLLNIAVRAARSAGEVIIRSLNRVESLKVTTKGPNDFVTEVDQAAEAEIIGVIKRHYPSHAFLAEESGASGDSDTVWIIDPLDGTTNFLHGFPVFAVSIACQIKGRLEPRPTGWVFVSMSFDNPPPRGMYGQLRRLQKNMRQIGRAHV